MAASKTPSKTTTPDAGASRAGWGVLSGNIAKSKTTSKKKSSNPDDLATSLSGIETKLGRQLPLALLKFMEKHHEKKQEKQLSSSMTQLKLCEGGEAKDEKGT